MFSIVKEFANRHSHLMIRRCCFSLFTQSQSNYNCLYSEKENFFMFLDELRVSQREVSSTKLENVAGLWGREVRIMCTTIIQERLCISETRFPRSCLSWILRCFRRDGANVSVKNAARRGGGVKHAKHFPPVSILRIRTNL